MKRKHIIYATDFSEASKPAFNLACVLAKAWKARLMIIHVNDTKLSPEEFGIPESDSIKKKLTSIVPQDITIDFQHNMLNGDPVKSLLHLVSEVDAELVIVGTHGRTGLQRVIVGSVAEQLIRKAPCPVLTVRQEKDATANNKLKPSDLQKILVPTDFSLHSYAALDLASSLAWVLKAGITILAVDDKWTGESDKHSETLWKQLSTIKPTIPGVSFAHKLLPGKPHEQIVAYANENEYDFVVLGTHGRTGAGRVLMGSVAEQVVRNANCPVLSVKPTNVRKPVLT